MKKEYQTPIIKVMTISHVHMLCTSVGELTQGDRFNNPNYDYIGGDSGNGYGWGVPD